MFSKLTRKFSNFLRIPVVFKNWIQVMGYVLSVYLPVPGLKKNVGIVVLRKGTCFKIRLINTLDLGSIMETHQRKVYTPNRIKIPANAIIIDIGASIGDFSIFCASSFRDCTCFAFEPTRNAFELCKENIFMNKMDDKIKIYPYAVSGQDGEIMIGGDAYKAISLQEILKRNKIEKCDLLKIDIEGAEYEVLLNTPKEILERVKAMAMECHIFDNGENLQRLKDYLTGTGFDVITSRVTVHNICYLYATRQ